MNEMAVIVDICNGLYLWYEADEVNVNIMGPNVVYVDINNGRKWLIVDICNGLYLWLGHYYMAMCPFNEPVLRVILVKERNRLPATLAKYFAVVILVPIVRNIQELAIDYSLFWFVP